MNAQRVSAHGSFTNSVGNIETWQHLAADIDEQHRVRGQEMRTLGLATQAARVESCGVEGSRWSCKQRLCPRCAEQHAKENAARAIASIRGMHRPHWVLFDIATRETADLRETVATCRKALASIRRRLCFRGVRAGVGGLELGRSDSDGFWVVHFHCALDADTIHESEINNAWRGLVSSRGRFSVWHRAPIVQNPIATAQYMTKASGWCPAPGSMPLHQLGLVRRAILGRHLLWRWPNARGVQHCEAVTVGQGAVAA